MLLLLLLLAQWWPQLQAPSSRLSAAALTLPREQPGWALIHCCHHLALQVAHFDIFGQRDCLETDMMYLNGVLPADVKVQDIQYAQPGEAQPQLPACGAPCISCRAWVLRSPQQCPACLLHTCHSRSTLGW
jgi:hypothetical protein